MKKTLLLCFIHGFQGGDDTFGSNSEFAQHLAAIVSASLPRVEVRAITYPKYETRGDLYECVGRFRDWLLEKVIDLEVANGTPSPTVDPSVRTILIGHSMGGIVAAETVIALSSEHPIKAHEGNDDAPSSPSFNGLMFPYVQGVLAFDTPFLGISPGVVAHGAEGQYNNAAAALTQLSGLTGMLFGASAASAGREQYTAAKTSGKKPVAALPAPKSENKQQKQQKPTPPKEQKPNPPKDQNPNPPREQKPNPPREQKPNPPKDQKQNPLREQKPSPPKEQKPNPPKAQKPNPPKDDNGWGWGKIAIVAGAASAIAAGGAAAYMNREQISEGWSWVGSHLEFVGCLGRAEELKARVRNMVRLNHELGVGFANLYTRLGKGAASKQVSMVGTVMGNQRTFCNLPSKQPAGLWKEAVNDAASDETSAHMTMFEPKQNPGYSQLSEDARNLIVAWARNEWYETSHRELE
ncbi:hypothetical protein F4779DRAFT_639059 [Xylariaceae sp. FL0662B]|nr:hypothetical protein F4779DRAFT_639059 [Xylariaceae sp. FL0662B]